MLHWDLKEKVCCQFMPDYYASYLLVCHDNSYSFCDQCQYLDNCAPTPPLTQH